MTLPDILDSGATRAQLKSLCSSAIVSFDSWSHRYSGNAQRQLGELWALLSAGCEFEIDENKTDETRICVKILYGASEQGKVAHENGIYEYDDLNTYFLPQPQRLTEGDWYL